MRIKKIASTLLQRITTIIAKDINNPRIKGITITKVEIFKDLDLATIYTIVWNPKNVSIVLQDLAKSCSFIKKKLAQIMRIRKIPNLRFVLDESIQKANKIEEIIKQVNK